MKNPYLLADKAQELLNKRAVIRFRKAKKACNTLDFNELNAIKACTELYSKLAKDNAEILMELAKEVYKKTRPKGDEVPDEDWLDAIFAAYDEVCLWIYNNEIIRKRDYFIESVVASKGKEAEFRRGMKLWSRMVAHITDYITDKALLKAYEDGGVKKVRWVTERDNKVCERCEPRDGRIYNINRVPPKPHVNCRCTLEAIIEGLDIPAT